MGGDAGTPGGPAGPDERWFTLHETLPVLDAPVLVVHLSGWIDASGAAAAALDAVERSCATRVLATFDGDAFIDYRARRPTMELREGVNERLVWPEIELKVGRTPSGSDLLVLSGPEPDAAWRRFADVATDLAITLGTRLAVMLGAYPFAAPHTRTPRLSSSSPSADLIATVPFTKNSVDVPAGMGAVLEHVLVAKGVPALGIWAQVPHYLGTMTHPAASLALLDGLRRVSGLDVEAGDLVDEAEAQRRRVDQLVSGNAEHRTMIDQLEAAYDAVEETGVVELPAADLPSADELAAEVERFLRDQGD
ncbi:MAG: PAC2 family protein [Ilumatobacteraceae bacterium]